ncbi:hypothetical protein JR316_0012960 [Psilocybe cubensis]|uniref:CFEM domain-containing protein n=2 Tax=Psilocybe cubensis TaxID=181762 RepID=A0A8H7XQJ2_PSICU|nr:hypothetical protein JR316_0012960 [Psilocybe cubensis]KAH9474500.1 hypothetical protein JR316_0012960 [Psilocybe cubensis]
MQFSTFAILFGAAATASATALNSNVFSRQSGLPNCAVPCALNADYDGCSPTDNHCLCTSSKFVDSTTTCVMSSCTGQDLQDALSFSQGVCLKVGVTLTSSAASSTSATSSSTASSSSATSTSPTTSGSSPNSSPSTNTSGASHIHGANAFVGLVAAGLVALAL